MEVLREKYRQSARHRRSKETKILYELAQALPLAGAIGSQLDKGTVLKLAISYIQTRSAMEQIKQEPVEEEEKLTLCKELEPSTDELGKLCDGFVMVALKNGDICFCNKAVNQHLGLSQVNVIGSSLYDLCHPKDVTELRTTLEDFCERTSETVSPTMFIRLRSMTPQSNKMVQSRNFFYKVMKCCAFRRKQLHSAAGQLGAANYEAEPVLEETESDGTEPSGVGEGEEHAEALPAAPALGQQDWFFLSVNSLCNVNMRTPSDSSTLVTKHSLDFKFIDADDRFLAVTKYSKEQLMSSSLFQFIHCTELVPVSNAMKQLWTKNQIELDLFRFTCQCGGYVWFKTHAVLLHDRKYKPVAIMCVHLPVGEVQDETPLLIQTEPMTTAEIEIEECDTDYPKCSSTSASDVTIDSGVEMPSSPDECFMDEAVEFPGVYPPTPPSLTDDIMDFKSHDPFISSKGSTDVNLNSCLSSELDDTDILEEKPTVFPFPKKPASAAVGGCSSSSTGALGGGESTSATKPVRKRVLEGLLKQGFQSQQVPKSAATRTEPKKKSSNILLNLLLLGEDIEFGYSLTKGKTEMKATHSDELEVDKQQQELFACLSQLEFYDSPSVTEDNMLHSDELLQTLEMSL